jgi:hypothetical protein
LSVLFTIVICISGETAQRSNQSNEANGPAQ